MKTTGIVICNYNKEDAVLECIQSVLESKYTDFDVFVVDNASTDNSVEKIKINFGNKVTVLENKENLGGSGGFNTGIRKVHSLGYKYIWCLDNDVFVDENALGALVEFMDEHPDAGMTGSKVVHMNNVGVIQQYGMTVDFNYFCVEANYLNYYNTPEIPEVVYSSAVAACSVLVRSSLIPVIGLLPEENFLYWDDTEWGIRCNLAGYDVCSYGKSLVAHAMGAKQEVVNTFTTYYAWRNWIAFFLKYTKESRLEDLCDTFLNSVFEIVYEGIYRNEKNKSKTVMFAMDDALHMNFGKAAPGKIFDIDKKDIHLKKLCSDYSNFTIYETGHESLAERIHSQILKYCPDAVIERITEDQTTSAYEHSYNSKASIVLCDLIFHQTDLSRSVIYIDENENIILTDEDVKLIQEYPACRNLFFSDQKPLFMNHARNFQDFVKIPDYEKRAKEMMNHEII